MDDTVTTPEDIELAIKYGIDGIVISNHGGRQLDGMPSTLDALRVCAPVAKGRIPIAVDGGIRRGSDIFKALALGASFCFIGRIPFWGLAVCVSFCWLCCLLTKYSTTDKKVWNWRLRSSAKNCGSPWHWLGKLRIPLFWNAKKEKKKKKKKDANRKQVPNDQRNSKLLPFRFATGWDSVEAVRDI
jgi:hypothetical protein